MSRLDDELREAFRREEPPPDFTSRVMRAVKAAPAPKRRWWDELLALVTTPRGRWVTVGAAASLLALVLATQFTRLEQGVAKEPQEATHITEPAPATTGDDSKTPHVAANDLKAPAPTVKQPTVSPHRRHHHPVRREGRITTTPEIAKSEGEIARDQLMLALHIASASLNEAQRIVRVSEGDQPNRVAR